MVTTPGVSPNTAASFTTERTALLSITSGRLEVDAPERWTWRDLNREVLVLGWLGTPVTVASALQLLKIVIPGMILGRLGTDAIGASALASSVASFTAAAPLLGLLYALDTLCSQASTGSSRPGLSGIYLQRCVLLCLAAFLPAAILWWNIHPVLIYLKQDPVIAAMASRYLRYEIFSFFFKAVFESTKKFFIAQGFHHAISLVQIMSIPMLVVFIYFLTIYPTTSIGFVGVPASVALSYVMSSLMAFAWLKAFGASRGWAGLSWEAFRGWDRMARLSIPGFLVAGTKTMAFDMLVVATSYLSPATLAAQAIIMMTIQCAGTVLLGLSAVAANRVGNLLGLVQPHRARNAAYAAVLCGTGVGMIFAVALLVVRHRWSYVFNPDPQVHAIFVRMVPTLAALIVIMVLASFANAILRGQGRPKIGAYINMATYYLVGAPVGFLTFHYTAAGIMGLWMALFLAMSLSTIGQLYFVLGSDWPDEVARCKARLSHDEHRANSASDITPV
ncbi:ethionine resistance protein [Tieghemiomyces parasiticus]|uniref:Ethionine resistance protein n=1 Tax=Tieghemiomyces parasiticus TaxID=78921 RepID=A0A9W8AAW7_9FUNG|nr:ethionine resistance protein [Tieghemiomyces parasiticus]